MFRRFVARVWVWRMVPGESGQSTAEYALVILGAVAIATVLITWATGSHAISGLFDTGDRQGASVVTGRRRFPHARRGGTARQGRDDCERGQATVEFAFALAAGRVRDVGDHPGRIRGPRPVGSGPRGARSGTGGERRS